jgi:Holliday junction resolvasome RuvABC endonuclease subunit
MSNILCVDLAFANVGCAVADVTGGKPEPILYVDTIHTESPPPKKRAKMKVSIASEDLRRAKEIAVELYSLIEKYKPKVIFAEIPTGASKSSKAAKAMGIAKGVLVAIAAIYEIPLVAITPRAAKRAATNNVDASKSEVKKSIRKEFSYFKGWLKGRGGAILEGKNEHVYDALSVLMAARNLPEYKDLVGLDKQ